MKRSFLKTGNSYYYTLYAERSKKRLAGAADFRRNLVQFFTGRIYWEAGANPEGIIFESREDMHVQVENFLTRRLTISQKEVYPFTPDARIADGLLNTHRNPEEVHADVFIHVSHVNDMLLWYHQNMPEIDGTDIHKSEDNIILECDTGWGFAGHDITKYTVAHRVPATSRRYRNWKRRSLRRSCLPAKRTSRSHL